ncbi:VLRF1 family aeRF1-type release factor [Nocardiopsis sp. RSe5-2]|uniref:VLRF1 family aeRF1-type release factor n=1 Tax=Nocardiopsis endophytica TaxID=3018445 RepID=A0ABT4U851_9ACTN|nr:VLRF1 family aeRF1-type release factor [Nocardiopsis endophytica]MDA2813129.1 VLRF1 family aeRF1-type release factor [Nocardiopsis endophytica]
MTDDMGVLSVYATADPRDRSSSPAWRLQIANEITALRNEVSSNGDKRRKEAVLARLEALRPQLDDVLDSGSESGVGRALFAPVSSDDVRVYTMQMPLEDCAVLERTAYLRPLAAAVATGAPAGVLAVSADGVRVVDMRFGIAKDITWIPIELDEEDWREMRGPARSHPRTFNRASGQIDRFNHKVAEHMLRYLNDMRPQLKRIADECGWSSVAITGEPQLTEPLRGRFAQDSHRDIIVLGQVVETRTPPEIAAQIGPEIEAVRVQRARDAAHKARDAALSGGAGAVGLSDVLGAFREARVAHLFLDGAARMAGLRSPDGAYFPQGEVPPGVDKAEMEPERDMGERMIEMALANGSEVTVLPEKAAEELSDDEGVAAQLRW